MTREFIDINDFTVLLEEAQTDAPTTDSCFFDEPVIAVAFYGSGNVNLQVRYAGKERSFDYTKGLALSFYADEQTEFVHRVSAERPLECIVVATALRNLENLPLQEGELFGEMLHQLVRPKDHYVEGPSFLMSPEMLTVVEQVFRIQYPGKAKMLFYRSQVTSLLAHFFGQLSLQKEANLPVSEQEQLERAREILLSDLENPPSLSELARQCGLNTFKLKKNFKEFFGLPVFKYLQNQRLEKAYSLIREEGLGIQEAAWEVGYDSLSSFSNAFSKKFGFRPSAIRR